MNLDQSRFPLVFMRADQPAQATPERQLEALLDREAPFVLVAEALDRHEHDETPAARKAWALFFKAQKDRLKRLCRGVVLIRGDKPLAAPLRLAAEGLGKVLGVGVRFVGDEAEALEVGPRLLATDL